MSGKPPSNASAGVTKTKWRMPLYMTGRVTTVSRMGNRAAVSTSISWARRLASALPNRLATRAPPMPATDRARKNSGICTANRVGT